jgi:hypothetical protein
LRNLERWFRTRRWRARLGALAAWVVGYGILTGLVILLLHLTLYPFPDNVRIFNPHDRVGP